MYIFSNDIIVYVVRATGSVANEIVPEIYGRGYRVIGGTESE